MKLLRFWVFGIMSVYYVMAGNVWRRNGSGLYSCPALFPTKLNDHPQAFSVDTFRLCPGEEAVMIGTHNMTEVDPV